MKRDEIDVNDLEYKFTDMTMTSNFIVLSLSHDHKVILNGMKLQRDLKKACALAFPDCVTACYRIKEMSGDLEIERFLINAN